MIRAILAHQWGWDEILYFAVPVIVVLFWVRWAEKRARSRRDPDGDGPTPTANMTDPADP